MSKQTIKGFTLIEVLIVTAIIGIISGVSWATLGTAKKGVDASSACTQVAAYFNKGRNYAVSGKGDTTVSVSGSTVNVGTTESYTLKGVSCGVFSSTYRAPDGIGTGTGNITCSASGATSRTVSITPYLAVCQ